MHRDFGCIEQSSRICSNPLCAEKSQSYQFESLGLKVYKDVEVVNFRLFDLEIPTHNACLRFTSDACRSPIRSLQDHYSYDRVERAYFLMAYRLQNLTQANDMVAYPAHFFSHSSGFVKEFKIKTHFLRKKTLEESLSIPLKNGEDIFPKIDSACIEDKILEKEPYFVIHYAKRQMIGRKSR